MKKKNDELTPEEKEEQKKQELVSTLLDEMLSAYTPATDGCPDYEPTSVELANRMSDIIHISPGVLALALKTRGFCIKLRGTVFRWQMKIRN